MLSVIWCELKIKAQVQVPAWTLIGTFFSDHRNELILSGNSRSALICYTTLILFKMEWPGFEPRTSSIRRGCPIHSNPPHLAPLTPIIEGKYQIPYRERIQIQPPGHKFNHCWSYGKPCSFKCHSSGWICCQVVQFVSTHGSCCFNWIFYMWKGIGKGRKVIVFLRWSLCLLNTDLIISPKSYFWQNFKLSFFG